MSRFGAVEAGSVFVVKFSIGEGESVDVHCHGVPGWGRTTIGVGEGVSRETAGPFL